MKTSIYPGWWQVTVSLVVQAVSAASIFSAYSIIAAPLKAEFQPSNMALMFGLTITSLASGLLSPLVGTAIDRFSIRHLMCSGIVLLSIGFLMLSFTTSMTQVIIVYGLFMALSSVLLGPLSGSALLSRWFTQRRGMAMGIASSGGAIGGLIIPPLLHGLIEGLDWRTALQLFSGGIFLLISPIVILLVVNRPADRGMAIEGADSTPAILPANLEMQKLATKQILRHPTFWLISLMIGSIFCAPIAVVSNMIQIVTTKGIDTGHGALLISMLSGAGFAGKLICAGLIDRVNLRLAIATVLGMIGLSLIVFLQADGFALLAAATLILGLSSGGGVPIWSLTLSRIYGPERIGQIMGIMTFVIMPFTLLSPPAYGRVFDQTGSYNTAFLGTFGLIAFALLWLTQLRVEQENSGEPATAKGNAI